MFELIVVFVEAVNNKYVVFDSGYGSVPVKLINTGNTNETVYLKIGDLSAIHLYNWNVTITYNGKNISEVNLSYNQTLTVYVKLTAIKSQHISTQISLILNGTVQGKIYSMPTLSVSFPSVPGLMVYPSGSNLISNYTGNPDNTLLTGSIILVIIIIVGIGSTAIVSRRNRK